MSDTDESSDQTLEIMRDLLHAERQQEITQATTLQGQIVSLVLLLRDLGLLKKEDIDRWETMSEKITELLAKMARANEVRHSASEEDPERQLSAMLEGADATIEFTRLMGNSDDVLQPLIDQRNDLSLMLKHLRGHAT